MKRLLVFVLLLIPFLYSGQGVIFLKSDPVLTFFKIGFAILTVSIIFFYIKWRRFTKESRVKKRKEKEEKIQEEKELIAEEKRQLKSAGIKKNYIPSIVAIVSFVIIVLVYSLIMSYYQIEFDEYGFVDYLIIIGIPSWIYGLLNKKLNSNLIDFKLKKEEERKEKMN